MKKVFSLTLIFSTLIYSEVNWEREQVCPVPAPTFVNSLIKKMSIEEKVGQVIQADLDFIKPSDLRDYPIGSVLNGGNTSPRGKLRASPAEWKSLAQEFYEESKRTGASIPVLWGTDAVHGHSNVFGATIFPHNIALGATRNENLLRDIGAAVAREVISTGIIWTFAPTIAVPQNDLWGRTYEGYSEDPELVSKLGKNFILGLQGYGNNFLNNDHVLATAKHFLGDGGTKNGIDQGNYGLPEGVAFIGSKGTLKVNRRWWQVTSEKDQRYTKEFYFNDMPKTNGKGNALDRHTKNFIECMRDNNKENLNCGLEEGSIAAINAHMGNIAFRTGKKIYWDKEKRSFNDIEADSFIRPKYHNGWKLPLI